MTQSRRIQLGLAAGFILVLVKILQPDQEYVRSLFASADPIDIIFYVFLSIVTICLGGASGMFSSEKEPIKILIFCASIPAMISTATGVNRDPESQAAAPQERAQIERSAPAEQSGLSFGLVSNAHAQTAPVGHTCVEDGFIGKFATSAGKYFTGSRNSQIPNYSVVVASTKNFDEAKAIANKVASTNQGFNPSVGCRRPGNDFYPVVIGSASIEKNAYQWIAKFEAAQILDLKPYISNYAYRSTIYQPAN